MAGLLAQLGGNPFNTLVGQKIEQATDGSLASENWALNMEICDIINETDEGPKDAVKAIRKRLQQNAGKNYTVVMYTLTVLETCVKNCGKRFHLLVTQKDFVQDLVKLIGPKNDPPTAVQEKVLSLIQSWAAAFCSNPEMQGVVQVYTDLKHKGIEFPSTDGESLAPIHTPSRSVPLAQPVKTQTQDASVQQQQQQQQQTNSVTNTNQGIHPQQIAKLRKELDIVQGNMRVFGEMLTELTPGKEHPSDLELLQDLYKTCHTMQSRIVELLVKVGNEEVTGELLQINDELNNLFLRYERFEKKRVAVNQTRSSLQSPEEPKPLIDLEESENSNSDDIHTQLDGLNLNAVGATSTSVKRIMAQSDAHSSNDEFDMLAQSRTLEHKKMSNATETSRPEQEGAVGVQKLDREQDFQEMERWLQDQPEDEGKTQDSIETSAHNSFNQRK